MGEQITAGFVTGIVVIGIVAVIYQFTKNKGSVSVATGGEKAATQTVGDLFKG